MSNSETGVHTRGGIPTVVHPAVYTQGSIPTMVHPRDTHPGIHTHHGTPLDTHPGRHIYHCSQPLRTPREAYIPLFSASQDPKGGIYTTVLSLPGP